MIWAVLASLFLTGCSWGPPEIDPHGVKALLTNLALDRIERFQSESEKKGRFPREKIPFLTWGPLYIRSDGKARILQEETEDIEVTELRPRRRGRSSTSLKLSTHEIYVEYKFRF